MRLWQVSAITSGSGSPRSRRRRGCVSFLVGNGCCRGSLTDPRSELARRLFRRPLYIDVRNLVRDFLPVWRVESTKQDLQDLQVLKAAIRANTKLVWIETPSNPLMKVLDISAIADIAHQAGGQLVVDNTFASPILQRPLVLGADVVLHSTTKYCGGHSDVQGACLVVKNRELLDKLFHVRDILGAVASPFNSWLILRGLRSLPCRMERHSANAAARCCGAFGFSRCRDGLLPRSAISPRTRGCPPTNEALWRHAVLFGSRWPRRSSACRFARKALR
ncbi:MAG: hypothetical protein DMG40_18725 [Acidobacteria bacterium]|nr:MAG: hypothetical protein DMG40_18725 [Acidobacteriota bacterium]